MSSQALTKENLELAAKTIRFLSADGVEKANSGHPGMPMGMAEIAAVLWLKHLKYNSQDPKWLSRDRFVVSNGHGSMLLYSLLHLAGFPLSLDDLKNFRQWGSKTPGHPESHETPGVECTTGPLGQGISNAVGMAMAEKVMASRYNTSEDAVIDHTIFCFVGDGCLMEGVSSEASSIAGHLGLGNLNVIYDDNSITIAGKTALAFSEDVLKRYEAYGWHVQRIDGHNCDVIDEAITKAKAETSRPSIIAAKTHIGKGSPNKVDTAGVHGAPLGADEMALAKKEAGFPEESFYVPEEVRALFAARAEVLSAEYAAWQEKFASWSEKNASKRKTLDSQLSLSVPKDLTKKLLAAFEGSDSKPEATRKLSAAVLQVASKEVNSLIGGSADLEPSTLTLIKNSTSISKDSFEGLNIHFGVREHAMGAIMNGFAYYGGFIPYGSTFMVFSDYVRPAVRIAALAKLPAIYVFTHDSVFVGEDGPTHQPIEHVGALRIIPNVNVFRPADAVETAVSYSIALSRKDGPSALSLTRQGIPQLERPASFTPEDIGKGAYTVTEAQGAEPEIVIIGTGSEVYLGVEAAKILSNAKIRVVSMPCCELYAEQSDEYKKALIPPKAKKVVIEAGASFGWHGTVGGSPEDTLIIAIDRFGISAPYKTIAENWGFTPEAVAEKIKTRFGV